MIFLVYIKLTRESDEEKISAEKLNSMFEKIDKSSTANVTKYFVYGTHFNLEGNVQIPKISKITIDSVHIVVNDSEREILLDTDFTYKDNVLSFSTIDKINEGISLENISSQKNYLFLKIVFSSSEEKYFSLSNSSSYGSITYYTMTKKSKVDISFDTYNNLPYLNISFVNIDNLPEDVYDIAIDASHGGKDTGSTSGKNTESEIVLDCAKILKQKLEDLGFKVNS